MVDLSIIIVSWNVSRMLAACLDSIRADGLNIETIVVDSASVDDTTTMLRTRYPHVQLLAQTENIGFTRANNIGLAAAKGRYLLLLNPDTEIIGDALTQMIVYMDAHPDVGILGPHTLNTDGTTQSTRRRFPTATVALFESTWLQPYAPASLLDHYYVKNTPDDGVFEVDWVQGSALLARREVYEQIGRLDEGYVMFSEELDWCKRAKLAGWHVVYLGTAQIIHHGGKSTEQVVARRHIHFQESKLRYFRKYHGRLFASVLRLFLLANYLWQLAIEYTKSLLGHKRNLRRERIDAYLQVLRSGLRVS
jgi:N-acetylglucosaminyl-diphospho-decaprenol L-rhamnosyltransferase